jgi:glycerophosphoryl diester phosphodiesterase
MRPVVIAHRGASGYLPEHTLPAKALAHAQGADYLEQDVVATRDDELVVLHDIHLDRITDVAARFPERARADGRYYVRDFKLEDLRKLSVHHRQNEHGTPVYPGRSGAVTENLRIHTLAEELAFIAQLNEATGRRAGVYPEIKRPAWHKQQGCDIAPQMLRVLAEFGYENADDKAYVQCFDAAELKRLREELGCHLKLVQLIGENSWNESADDFDSLRTKRGLRSIAEVADAIGPWLQHTYKLTPKLKKPTSSGLVANAHALGLAVHPYTLRRDDLPSDFANVASLLEFLFTNLNVDGIFSDFPDIAIDFISRGRKNR